MATTNQLRLENTLPNHFGLWLRKVFVPTSFELHVSLLCRLEGKPLERFVHEWAIKKLWLLPLNIGVDTRMLSINSVYKEVPIWTSPVTGTKQHQRLPYRDLSTVLHLGQER